MVVCRISNKLNSDESSGGCPSEILYIGNDPTRTIIITNQIMS